jgi:hypothetical protein
MKQPLNEQFIRMQKLAGIITESKYREDIQETTLSPEEQKIADDIINTLNEGVFDDVLEKIKSYAKKGLMTAAILSSLLASPGFSQDQKQSIQQVVKTEMPVSYAKRNTADINKMSNTQAYDAMVKAIKSTTPDIAISYLNKINTTSKEEEVDKNMLITFINSVQQGKPMGDKEYIGKRIKQAYKFSQDFLYAVNNNMSFFK